MTLPANHVFDIAQSLLAQVVDIYASETPAIELPSRRYVSEAAVAHDCVLVAVELVRVFRGGPGSPVEPIVPQRCASIRVAEFKVHIVRCASTPQESGDPPSTATIESFSEPIYTDAWILPSRLQYRAAGGELVSPCNDILIGELTMFGPLGGFGGVVLSVEWLLGG